MATELHIEADEAHHIPYGVWSSTVERLTVNQVRAGSNPVTPPTRMILRPYQLEALESFRQPMRPHEGAHRLTLLSPVVAQSVERRSEAPGVAGSIPARGTRLKRKM